MDILKASKRIMKYKNTTFINDGYKLYWKKESNAILVKDTRVNIDWNPLEGKFLDMDWEEIKKPVVFMTAVEKGGKIKWISDKENSIFREYMYVDEFLRNLTDCFSNDEIVDILLMGEFYTEGDF